MLRAIIGTAAVLAGFCVVERAVDAGTDRAGPCTAIQGHAERALRHCLDRPAEPARSSAR